MSVRNIATSTAVALSLIAGQIALTSTASAGEWRHRGFGYGHGGHPAPRHVAPAPRFYGHGGHHQPHRRDRSGEAVAGAILGIGALIVGAAVADAARRNHSDRHVEDDND